MKNLIIDQELKDLIKTAIEAARQISEMWTIQGGLMTPEVMIQGFITSLYEQMSEIEPDQKIVLRGIKRAIEDMPGILARVARGDDVSDIWGSEPPRPFTKTLH